MLPFCRPKEKKLQAENLGEMISGDMIENSVYNVSGHFFPPLKSFFSLFIENLFIITAGNESSKVLCCGVHEDAYGF